MEFSVAARFPGWKQTETLKEKPTSLQMNKSLQEIMSERPPKKK